jgi:hypothetical protein
VAHLAPEQHYRASVGGKGYTTGSAGQDQRWDGVWSTVPRHGPKGKCRPHIGA